MQNSYCYFPILKTTDAELKAYKMLDEEVKLNILPVFELTRSRLSKKNTTRTIYKRIESLKKIVIDKPFILDLTTQEQLSNEEIEKMLGDNSNGFEEWVNLIKELKEDDFNLIPMIHYNPYCIEDVEKQIKNLQEHSNYLAFRVLACDEDLPEYLQNISKYMDFNNLILILDAEFRSIKDAIDKSSIFSPNLSMINVKPKAISCAFSSFPESVTRPGYGNDENGAFARSEKITYENLIKGSNADLIHGDYASVHPKRYDTMGGQWIPRIDYLSDTKMHYYRFRRPDGGYEKAASYVFNDSNYQPNKIIKTWGDKEIEAAANGEPNGKSPSHWISVRINLYISKQYTELKGGYQMKL